MKMQDRIFFKQIIKPAIVNFSNMVEETFVREFKNGSRKIFTSVDMWNIQRQRKSLLIR